MVYSDFQKCYILLEIVCALRNNNSLRIIV